ncbi:MAG: type II toxin-antitoxin system VapC family toxin [Thiocapsa sp.]|uniref:type II toxin-antitoxin system VapC family toxin n=1 Tax=Thiocapsa sp. TaxID=2024551 RepID=UPI001BD0A00D|nr:type II toxin-antitoxin system VapC family toxin [Thiocapsa sp.]QVL48044.1 MAG: type II toxin-antitoxin system VapC family toxin [Thiocapsa sp.]
MILFCDTSAVVKLYVAEPDSSRAKGLVAEADAVVVCRIAWAEFHAAVARRARAAPADQSALELAKADLARDWPHYVVMEVTQNLVVRAGEFADAFALRGYDAVQLAAAHIAMVQSDLPLCFSCFDRRLNQAAKLLGLTLP